jgi:hypothetical protein
MKLGEFFIDLIVDTAKGELTVGNLVSRMGELEVASVGALGILVELSEKLAGFTDTAIKMSLGLKDISTLTDVNTQDFQKWVRVAEHMQVSGEAVTSTVKSLSASIAEMKLTGKGNLLPLAQILGIDLRGKDVFQILDSIRRSAKFQGYSNAEKTQLLSKVGIDPMLARVFELSNKQFETIGNQFAGMSKKGQKDFFEMSQLLTDIHHAAQQIVIDIAEWDAGPLLKSLRLIMTALNDIQKWFDNHQKNETLRAKIRKELGTPTMGEEFKKPWAEIFRYMWNPYKDVHTMTEAELLGRSVERAIPQTVLPTPARNIEVHNTFSFNGVHTPDSLKRALTQVVDDHWNKKLIQNGQVLSSGEVLA